MEASKPGFMEPVAPLPVNVIGVRTEGTGTPIADGQVVKTPDHHPDLVFSVVRPIVAILIRAAGAFLKALMGGLGLAGGAAATGWIPWATWQAAIAFAVTAALIEAAWSAITVLNDLEKQHPLLTGSI